MGTGVRHKTRGHGRVTAFDEASHHPYEVTFDNGEVRSRPAAGGGLTPFLRGGSALDCKPRGRRTQVHKYSAESAHKLDVDAVRQARCRRRKAFRCTPAALWHFVHAARLRRLC